jgi:hypothetical protein
LFRGLNLRAEAAAFADEEALGFVEEGASAVAAKVLAQGLSWIYLRLETYSQEPLEEREEKPQIS